MNIINGVKDRIKDWLLSVALGKAIKSAAKLVVAWAVTQGIKVSFTFNGIVIDSTNEGAMIVAINSGLTILRNWLKFKSPKYFFWI